MRAIRLREIGLIRYQGIRGEVMGMLDVTASSFTYVVRGEL